MAALYTSVAMMVLITMDEPGLILLPTKIYSKQKVNINKGVHWKYINWQTDTIIATASSFSTGQ